MHESEYILCPRCGSPLIHVNEKYFCPSCGYVAGETSSKKRKKRLVVASRMA